MPLACDVTARAFDRACCGIFRCAQRGAPELRMQLDTLGVPTRTASTMWQTGRTVSFSQHPQNFSGLRRVMIPACLLCREHL